MRLDRLLEGFTDLAVPADRVVSGLTMDSRRVRPGDLFLACQGSRGHGADHVEGAILAGAVAVAVESELPGAIGTARGPGGEVLLIPVRDLRRRAGLIAARFHGEPSQRLRVVGITGTNGKTSISQFIARALAEDGPAAVVGTLGSGLVGRLAATGHTTPDAVSLQASLAGFLDAGARTVAMEVSSHGLHQGRVNGVRFAVAVFTNLTHEHLDYHGDMDAYAEAKRRLFGMPGLEAAILNLDDPVGRAWMEQIPSGVQRIGYGLDPAHGPAVLGYRLELHPSGLALAVATPRGEALIESGLIGRFNASNLLAALGALLALGMPPGTAAERLSRLRAVPGRMERFGGGPGRPTALVDYAHTPDALEQVLRAARAHCRGTLWCLFGCGGDRDRAKRPLMGAVAERLADVVLLTDDNPRSEKGEAIVEEIRGGMRHPERVRVVRERGAAIALALSEAREGDVVLIAGKGHETEQQIGERRLPFSDRAEVARHFGEEVGHG